MLSKITYCLMESALGVYYPQAIHRQSAYSSFIRKGSDLHVSEQLANVVLSLPCFPSMTELEQEKVIDTVKHFLGVNVAYVKIHPSSVVDRGAEIGEGTVIWHFCHISTGSKIGTNCSLGQNVFVAPNVKVGNGVKIQNNVSLFSGVEIEDNVFWVLLVFYQYSYPSF